MPLPRLHECEVPRNECSNWNQGEVVAPGGLIEEHDGGIVDQLQGDGQSFTLTAGETAGARLSTFQEAQSR